MVTQLSNAATSTTSGPYTTSASAQAAAAIMRFGGLGSSSERPQEKPVEEPLREEDGQLSVEVAEKMLKWHAEAVGRCMELCPVNDVCVRTQFLWDTIDNRLTKATPQSQTNFCSAPGSGCCNRERIYQYRHRDVRRALPFSFIKDADESTVRHFSVQARLELVDTKSEPSMQPLTVLRNVDLICHLWQHYVNIALLPLASSSVTVRREMVIFNNQMVSHIEGSVNQVLQRMTDSERLFLMFALLCSSRANLQPLSIGWYYSSRSRRRMISSRGMMISRSHALTRSRALLAVRLWKGSEMLRRRTSVERI